MTPGAPLVLVVDDDPSVRKSLSRLLASADYTVEAFASAQEFLPREPHSGPCCLVLDVRMPGLTGILLQAPPAATGRRVSIVFVTGHAAVPTSARSSPSRSFACLRATCARCRAMWGEASVAPGTAGEVDGRPARGLRRRRARAGQRVDESGWPAKRVPSRSSYERLGSGLGRRYRSGWTKVPYRAQPPAVRCS